MEHTEGVVLDAVPHERRVLVHHLPRVGHVAHDRERHEDVLADVDDAHLG